MKEIEINKQAMLSEHFSLGEMTKTSYHTADGKKMDFDELFLERRGTTIWVHFAVKPRGNRRHVEF